MAWTDDLVAYWAFEETDGVGTDVSGNGRDLVPVNSPSQVAGRSGQAFHAANGASPSLNEWYKVTEPDSTQFGIALDEDFAFSFWLFLTAEDVLTDRWIASYGRTEWGGSFESNWHLLYAGGHLQFDVPNSLYQASGASVAASIGVWHHVYCEYRGASDQRNFIEIDCTTNQTGAVKSSIGAIQSNFQLGVGERYLTNPDSGPSNSAKAFIDEFGVWRRTLTSAERVARCAGAVWPGFGTETSQIVVKTSAGLRRRFNTKAIRSMRWSDERYGGWKEFALQVNASFTEVTNLQHGDLIELWWKGQLRYRGTVTKIKRNERDPQTMDVSGYALSFRVGQPIVQRPYLYPVPKDVARVAADMAADVVTPVLPDLQIQVRDTGATAQIIEAQYQPFGRVLDELSQTLGENKVVYGTDVDSVGQDRFFVRPFNEYLSYLIAVPGNKTLGGSTEEDSQGIVNRLTILGGPPRYPNLVYNASFERARFGGSGAGNLLENGGFETQTIWTRSGGASYKQSGGGTGEGSAYAGSAMAETDTNGEYFEQTQNPPATAVVVGRAYVLSVRAKSETAGSNAVGRARLTWLTSGGSTISTEDIDLPAASSGSTPKLTVYWTEWKKTVVAPATAAGVRIRLSCESGGAIAAGILWDECELYDGSLVYQDGWELVADGTAVANVVDWAYRDSYHGGICVFLSHTASDDNANDLRLQPIGGKRFDIQGGGAYTASVYLKSPPGVTANAKMILQIEEFKSDGNLVGTTQQTIAAGAGWSSWTQTTVGRTMAQTSTHAVVSLLFRGNGQVLIDAIGLRDSAAGSTFVPDGDFVSVIDVTNGSLTGLESGVTDSITDYGYRDRVESVPSITTQEDALAYASAYFNANAVKWPNPVVELDNDDRFFRPGELVRLAGPDGQTLFGSQTRLPIVKLDWVYESTLKVTIQMKRERPDVVADLIKRLKREQRETTARGSLTGTNAGSPPTNSSALLTAEEEDGSPSASIGTLVIHQDDGLELQDNGDGSATIRAPEIVNARDSSLFGPFVDVDARIEALEAAILSGGLAGPSLDFGYATNSQYIPVVL